MFDFRFRSVSLIFAFLLLALLPAKAVEGAGFTYAQATLGGGISSPQGVAVDASGNVFVTDT